MRERKRGGPHVVLVGAGTSHLVVLDGMRMSRWLAGATVTLVSPTATVLYSGMLPAVVAGEYDRQAIEVDLVSLCARAGARLVLGTAEKIDFDAKTVTVGGRAAPLRYDLLAQATGAEPAGTPGDAIPVRPFAEFLDAVEKLPRTARVAVVGGGASGVEIATALAVRGHGVCLFEGGPQILADLRPSVAKAFRRRLSAMKVRVECERFARTFREGTLRFDDGSAEPFDGCVWAAGSAPPRWEVGDDLRVVGRTDVFATGDAASVRHRRYRRNGVVAVRQGRVLAENLDRAIRGERLVPFRLRRPTLWILNGGAGAAVAGFGRLAVTARWARRWKERIDRRWMARFAVPRPAPSTMLCDGCGGKAPAGTLEGALPAITWEDVGVWQAGAEWTAGSIDQITSWTDDAYVFGEIATLHALSDAYAKGLGPEAALVAATLPVGGAREQVRTLEELDRGVRATLEREGVLLAAGHTGQGEKLALAVAVVAAFPDPAALLRKDALRPGDWLVLTKPLGTGIVLAAMAQGACPAGTWLAALATMRESNRDAARRALEAGVRAATDVTGFGFARTIAGMLQASKVEAEIYWDKLPVLPGVPELYASPLRPSLWEENRRGMPEAPPWAYDPQTSGGLLVGTGDPSLGFVVGRVVATAPSSPK